ncbi:MAG: hypothetical protein A2Y57_03420 [Candidatus Woykebacteria bacterium RBG_13_40_7b]|uniref:Uncharacterized protein n=1 Tax=Candidatus Woykebacteria bacterium RBG_13_40_7b TaxID=1802594 RepID=A0A1G1W9L7_9BACT|nr:MAG: hypothetical protein A2Y57_03420 [Candidatus Woykebacteria bacterium RBG_13_40_7b]
MNTFKISIPTDNGFFGRQCNNPSCKRYFKVHQDSLKEKAYCPYCGQLFNKDELWTLEQLNFATEKVKEESLKHILDEFDKIGQSFNRGNIAGGKSPLKVSVSYKSNPYVKKYIPPPSEKNVDTEIVCSSCKAKFQVYGIFGYCPVCKCENILIYDTNIKIILKGIAHSDDKNRQLRHTYNDLVSTFEDFCKRKNKSKKKYNFQNLQSIRLFFNNRYGENFLESLSKEEDLCLRRIFQKRHLYQHNKGIVDQEYLRVVPEDVSMLTKLAPLSVEEFKLGADVIRKILLRAK